MLRTFSESICAGLLISVGGCVFLSCENRYVGAILFSVALLCICYMEYYLFTGKIAYITDDRSPENIAKLFIGLCGNLLSTFLLGMVIRPAIPFIGDNAVGVFEAKLLQSPAQTVLRAAFCGMLMYLAVDIFRKKKSPIAILFCIPTFILSGFEHSVADMFYFGASGIYDIRAAGFLSAVIIGNTLGAVVLPLLEKVPKGHEPRNSPKKGQF